MNPAVGDSAFCDLGRYPKELAQKTAPRTVAALVRQGLGHQVRSNTIKRRCCRFKYGSRSVNILCRIAPRARGVAAGVLVATLAIVVGPFVPAQAQDKHPTVISAPGEARKMSESNYPSDGFGCAEASSATHLVVGSYGQYHQATGLFGPPVFWAYPGAGRGTPAGLSSPDAICDSGSVAISGSTVLLAQTNGTAYVYQEDQGGWEHSATLVPQPMTGSVLLLHSSQVRVAISGNIAVLGEPETIVDYSAEVGEVFVFQKDGRGWHQVAKLGGELGGIHEGVPLLAPGSGFGSSVALSGGAVAVTATGIGAYVFRETASGWHLEATLSLPGGGEASSDVVLFGPLLAYAGGADDVVIFKDATAGWHLDAILHGFKALPLDYLGGALATSGHSLYVAGTLGDEIIGGGVYVFNDFSHWVLSKVLPVPDNPDGAIGISLAAGASKLFVCENSEVYVYKQ